MSEEKSSTVGRPRLYTSSSEKVSAFRNRQLSEGYVRKEILVDKKTWEVVSLLAHEHGVSASDAGAGLLEYGLEQFKNQTSTWATALSAQVKEQDPMMLSARALVETTSPSTPLFSATSASADTALRSIGNTTDKPMSSDADRIRDFFNKRKKAQNNDIQS